MTCAELSTHMFGNRPRSLLLEDNICFTPPPYYERTSATWTDARNLDTSAWPGDVMGYHQERTMSAGENDATVSECIISFDLYHPAWPKDNLDDANDNPSVAKKKRKTLPPPSPKKSRKLHTELLHALNPEIPFDMLIAEMEKHFVRTNFGPRRKDIMPSSRS